MLTKVDRSVGKNVRMNKYTFYLIDVLLCGIAEYFYECCRNLTSPLGESKYKQQVKIRSDTTQQNV